jgi:RNA polymerase sigma-70 factor (ECF subfamily)
LPNLSKPPGVVRDDETLLAALKAGAEEVFRELVDRWGSMMLRVALMHVHNRAVAEEVVQDAWLAVLRSLDRFERRSAFRTWVLGIVVNLARSRARAERRSSALSAAVDSAVDPARFLPADHAKWPRHWAIEPRPWRTPEEDLLAAETVHVISETVAQLPAAQREVLVLRDFEGVAADEVCNILNITGTHQRVLLHRARSRVRAALERYLTATEAS